MKTINANDPTLKAIPVPRDLPRPRQENINVNTEQSAAAINRPANMPPRFSKYWPTDHVLKANFQERESNSHHSKHRHCNIRANGGCFNP
jgi:hypothetical protein